MMFVAGWALPLALLTGHSAGATGRPCDGIATSPPAPGPDAGRLPIQAVESIGMTVSNLDAAVDFYTRVLAFTKISEHELAGRPQELLQGVFGARMRMARLRLGEQVLELTEYLAPKGRPVPADARANDLAFQHVAIVVSDMAAAYGRLRSAGVAHASTAPQRLPDWNVSAGGIRAFYFRDPDGHFLEVLEFPPGKGAPSWHRTDPLFLGIDHTAIVVSDTEESLRLYRDQLGLRVAGESENYDTEQEHLNGVFGARLRITTLRAAAGPGIEFLEYLAPGNGRPGPLDLAANDLLHWHTTLRTGSLAPLMSALRLRTFRLVSPGAVDLDDGQATRAALLRDRDGHGLKLVAAGPEGRDER